MKFVFRSSFDKCYKKLNPADHDSVDSAIEGLARYFQNKLKPQGLGLKKLQEDFWEIRASIRIRIIFSFQEEVVSFVLVGNHEDVKRFLISH